MDSDADYDDLWAIVVHVYGRTVFERFRESRPAGHHAVYSVTKNLIATLVCIAEDEGRLSLESTLWELLHPRSPDTMTVWSPLVSRSEARIGRSAANIESLGTQRDLFFQKLGLASNLVEGVADTPPRRR